MLICPLCQTPLQVTDKLARCVNGHVFDRARQGYLNLLPVQHKASRAPGDNADMVQARRRFLSAGHYAPIADFVCQQVQAVTGQPASWLDIGCGEGYYTDQLARRVQPASSHALDISKDAIRQAARTNRDVHWMVASMARIPLATGSCDLVTSLFAPLHWAEVQRLLQSAGHCLHLGPANEHLLELRQLIYDQVRPYDDSKHLARIPDGLRVTESAYLRFQLALPDPADRAALLAMTPHGQRVRAERRAEVIEGLTRVTVAVRLDCIQHAEY